MWHLFHCELPKGRNGDCQFLIIIKIIIKPYLYSALQNISRRFTNTIKMQDIIKDKTWIIETTKEIHNNNGNSNERCYSERKDERV